MDGRRMKATPSPALAEHDFGEEISIKKGALRHHQRQWPAVWTKGDGRLGFELVLATAAGEKKGQRECECDGWKKTERWMHGKYWREGASFSAVACRCGKNSPVSRRTSSPVVIKTDADAFGVHAVGRHFVAQPAFEKDDLARLGGGGGVRF